MLGFFSTADFRDGFLGELKKFSTPLTGQDPPIALRESKTNFGAPATGGPQNSGANLVAPDGRPRSAHTDLQPGRPRHHEPEKLAFHHVLHGGLADKKKPLDFDPAQLRKGVQVEREHTDSRHLQTEIAMDHLEEDPRYYQKLEKMEKKAFFLGFSEELVKLAGFLRERLREGGVSADPARRDPAHRNDFMQARHDARTNPPAQAPGLSTASPTAARQKRWNGAPGSADARGQQSTPRGADEIQEPMVSAAASAADHYAG